MSFILKLKHWQAFLILIFGLFLNNFAIEDNQTLTTILSLIGGLIYFSWPIFIGYALYQFLPTRIELSYNLFLFNSFIYLISYSAVTIISDTEGMKFDGLAALPGFYVFYALLQSNMFPARVLKSIERERKVDIGECFGSFFLIIVLPIGIWFLQPRLNKVVEEHKNTFE